MASAVVMPLMMSAGFVLSLGVSLAARRVAAPAVWRRRRERRMMWVGDGAPDDQEARTVWDAVVCHGFSTYGEVAEYVADCMFRQDHERGGWLSDIGLFYPWYLLHACVLLERLQGRSLRIDGS